MADERAQPRWKIRPPGSTWGDFGPDDQRGRMNLLTPAKVLEGLAEVRVGQTFCLSLPLDVPGGNGLNAGRFPPVLRPTLRAGRVNFNCLIDGIEPGRTDVMSDDLAVLHLQYSTQWDGLAHAGSMFDTEGDGIARAVYYNGFRAGVEIVGPGDVADCGLVQGVRMVSTSSARALGIENMAQACVQGRAVMVDLRAHFGAGRTLVGYDALMRVLEADGVEVTTGDLVCFHTGFAEVLLGMDRRPDFERLQAVGCVLDGRDDRLLQWVTDCGAAALIADNYAVEAFPARPGDPCCAMLPLHEHCLFKLGAHLGELWRLTPLAEWLRAHGRSRFLLTAPPLNLPGAIGSPVTPIATV